MLKKTILLLVAGACLALGQVSTGGSDGSTIAIYPPPNEAFAELKQYLTLSDAQLDQLRALLDERTKALQEYYNQIQAKQTELDQLLKNGSRDTARIGQLTIDIYNARNQAPLPTDTWRQRALAVLTAEQKTKLVALDQAMKLATTAYQAVSFNLIDPPPPGRPIIMGGLAAFSGAAETAPVTGPVTLPAPIR